jgi:ankyrin repeat protein
MAAQGELAPELITEFVQVSHGDFARVKELLAQHPALVNAAAPWNETPIQAAAHVGNRPIAEYLLAAGAPLDICTAAMLGLPERVAGFLQSDPALAQATGAHGIPVLFYAAIGGHSDVAALLLASGADVNAGAGMNTPLHGAAGFGQAQMVAWLLEHGAEVNALNYSDKTPLALALEAGREDIANLLRRHG